MLQNPDELYALIDRANRLEVLEEPISKSPLLYVSADRADLDALRVAVQVLPVERAFHCMCIGSPAIYLYHNDELLGQVTNHHSNSIRFSGWKSDALIADRERWLAWFDERKITGPRTEFLDDQQRAEKQVCEFCSIGLG